MSNSTSQPKKVFLRAPLLTSSGYGVHSRQIAQWLFKLEDEGKISVDCEPVPWGQTPWLTDTDALGGLVGRILQQSRKSEHYDVAFSVQLPDEWDPFLADYNVGVTAGVEADRCYESWIDCVNKMDKVIVPSTFSKQVFTNSAELYNKQLSTQIDVVPESFVNECMEEHELDLDLKTDFNFLVVSQFTGNNPENDRKNIPYTLKWMAEVFSDRPDIGVILKTNLGRNTKYDRMNVQKNVMQLLSEVKKGPGPHFYVLHGAMTNEEMVGLYQHPKVKCFVSFTHGEGYGLPILEAAACGKPVMVTNHSGHLDFLSKGKFIKVGHKLGLIHESRVDDRCWAKGAQWAYPFEDEAKRALKKFTEASTVPSNWAKDLRPIIQKEFNLKAIMGHYDAVMKEVL